MSNGAEQWCPVKGSGYISEVSFQRSPNSYIMMISYILNYSEFCIMDAYHYRILRLSYMQIMMLTLTTSMCIQVILGVVSRCPDRFSPP